MLGSNNPIIFNFFVGVFVNRKEEEEDDDSIYNSNNVLQSIMPDSTEASSAYESITLSHELHSIFCYIVKLNT